MAYLNFGDIQVPLYTSQVSSPTLKVMDSKGVMYYIPLISEGGCVATGVKELFYEETSFNTCKTLDLPAGCYRIEMQGGFGGGKCNVGDDAEQMGDTIGYNLRLQQPMTISLFRGGDGNSSALSAGRGVGGGASGLASFAVLSDGTVIEASGGSGEQCAGIPAGYSISSANASCSLIGTYGGSGSVDSSVSHSRGGAGQAWCSSGTTVQEIITYKAPSGGGSKSGAAGAYGTLMDSFVSYTTAPGSGSMSGGGSGGGIQITYNGATRIGTGGAGGATVSYTCGNHTVYSYGGGGGGGACYRVTTNDAVGCFDGMDGASGSTNTSTTSYIKIYKL